MEKILTILGDARGDLSSAVNSLPNNNGVGSGNLTNILYWIYAIGGIAAVAVIVYGGVSYISANGDSGKVKKATQTVIYAVIGLVLVLLAGAITAFASGAIGGSK